MPKHPDDEYVTHYQGHALYPEPGASQAERTRLERWRRKLRRAGLIPMPGPGRGPRNRAAPKSGDDFTPPNIRPFALRGGDGAGTSPEDAGAVQPAAATTGLREHTILGTGGVPGTGGVRSGRASALAGARSPRRDDGTPAAQGEAASRLPLRHFQRQTGMDAVLRGRVVSRLPQEAGVGAHLPQRVVPSGGGTVEARPGLPGRRTTAEETARTLRSIPSDPDKIEGWLLCSPSDS